MAKKIVEVKDEKKSSTKKSVDLNKLKDVIVENKDTIATIVDVAGDLLSSKDTKKTTKKNTTKKSTGTKAKKSTKSDSDSLSKVFDLASTFLKK